MKTRRTSDFSRGAMLLLLAAVALTLAPESRAGDAKAAAPAATGASPLGGAVPGGAVVSARYVIATPAVGGQAASAPIANDGTFRLAGLAPGPYRMSISSVTTTAKQTQGATFGEKVNAGLNAAGSAVAQGAGTSASRHDTAKNSVGNVRGREIAPSTVPATDTSTAASATEKGVNDINGGMPNRISMNVTVARQTHRVDLDGPPVTVDVGADGQLSGKVAAAQ